MKTKSHSYVTNLALSLRLIILMYIFQLFTTCSYVIYVDNIHAVFINATIQLICFLWAFEQLNNFSLDSRIVHVSKFIIYIVFETIFLLNVQYETTLQIPDLIPYFLLRTITSIVTCVMECTVFYYSTKIMMTNLSLESVQSV